MADARDIARAIMGNWLEEQSARRGQVVPETKQIPTYPSVPDQQHYGYTVPNDPLLQMLIMRQLTGGGGERQT